MKWAFSVLVILLSLFLNACGGDDDFNRRFVDPSQVRFVNLVPNAPTLSYDLNGTLFATVSYAQSSGLRTVSAGSFEAVVSHFDAAGTTEVIIDTIGSPLCRISFWTHLLNLSTISPTTCHSFLLPCDSLVVLM